MSSAEPPLDKSIKQFIPTDQLLKHIKVGLKGFLIWMFLVMLIKFNNPQFSYFFPFCFKVGIVYGVGLSIFSWYRFQNRQVKSIPPKQS